MRRLAVIALLALGPAAPAAAGVPAAPQELPAGAARAAAAGPANWIVGSRPGRAGAAIARRHGAEAVAPGAYVVRRGRARALARDLERRGLLRWSEADRPRRRAQAGSDPLSGQAGWRDAVADPSLTPPPVGPDSPLLALVDSPADVAHEEFRGGAFGTLEAQAPFDLHGTATAAVAAAPVNGVGIVGVWPGMRALNVPLPARISCSDSARGIAAAVRAGAAVINMSYGSGVPCYAEYVALQFATAAGATLVAAAGNEFADGNPLEYPASLPHVLTIAAVDATGRPAYFSNENAAVDLAAPGVAVLTAVPPGHDPDGDGDGWAALDGTSFAAPMVAAAAAWVRQARPDLASDQVAQVVRLSARDLEREGYDTATGFGLLDVGAALQRTPPPADPQEPNEDLEWIDGRALGRRNAAIWSGGRKRRLTALLDAFEDPIDAYRIRVPGRARVRIVVRPRFGDPDLRALGARARHVGDRSALLATSTRRGERREIVTLRNRGRRTRTAYAVVDVDARRRSLDSVYRLVVKRLPRR